MKLVAHPMVVAVALGLLGPAALAEELNPIDEAPMVAESTDWDRLDAPTAEEVANAESAWLAARER